jgi:hypothetical protein
VSVEVSLAEARALLGETARALSDAEVERIRRVGVALADVIFDDYWCPHRASQLAAQGGERGRTDA